MTNKPDHQASPNISRKSIIVAWIISGISIAVMINNLIEYLRIKIWFETSKFHELIFVSIFFIFFAHIILLTINIKVSISLKSNRLLSKVSLIIGIISFISIFYHYGCLCDIIKEYPAGLEIQHELTAMFIALSFHFLFLLLFSMLLFRIYSQDDDGQKTKPMQLVEHLYLTLHIVGITCAVIGLFKTFQESLLGIAPVHRKWYIFPELINTLIPYFIVLLAWIFVAIRNRRLDVFDEKQKSDLSKAGSMSMLLSIPFMSVIFAITYNNVHSLMSLLWFPYFIFFIMLIFSISALFYFRNV